MGERDQKDLDVLPVEQAKEYAHKGHFAPSMLPKINAATALQRPRKGG